MRPAESSRPPVSAIAVTVPIVSKKSTMTIESSSGSSRMSSAPRRSAWNTVSNRGTRNQAPSGKCDRPNTSPATVALPIPRTMAPGTFFESRNAMMSRPPSARRGSPA